MLLETDKILAIKGHSFRSYLQSSWESANNKMANFEKDAEGYVQVYVSGSSLNEGCPNASSGLGVYFGEGNPLQVSFNPLLQHY